MANSSKNTVDEKAIVPAEAAGAVALYEDIDWADDGVNEEEIRISWPMIRLVQGTTRGLPDSDRHIGDFYHPDTQAYSEKLVVVPLQLRTQRAFFEAVAEQPVCTSLDGIAPQPNQLLWTKPEVTHKSIKGSIDMAGTYAPGHCVDCMFFNFSPEGNPPLCGETILMMVRRGDGSFAQFRVGGTGLKPVRQALGRMVANNKRLPAFAHKWTFSSVTMEKPGQKWKQLQVSTEPLSRAEAQEMNALVQEMRAAMTGAANRSLEAEPVDVGYDA